MQLHWRTSRRGRTCLPQASIRPVCRVSRESPPPRMPLSLPIFTASFPTGVSGSRSIPRSIARVCPGEGFPSPSPRPYPQNATQTNQSVSYGAKFQVTHLRDPLDLSNKNAFQSVSGALRDAGAYANDYQTVEQHLRDEYQTHPCQAAAGIASNLLGDGTEGAFIAAMANPNVFAHFLPCISGADIAFIDSHTTNTFAALSLLTPQLADLIKRIRSAPQIALSFLSKISMGTGSNLYRSEIVMDRGFWKIGSTTNASFDFSNSKTTKPNKDTLPVCRGARSSCNPAQESVGPNSPDHRSFGRRGLGKSSDPNLQGSREAQIYVDRWLGYSHRSDLRKSNRLVKTCRLERCHGVCVRAS